MDEKYKGVPPSIRNALIQQEALNSLPALIKRVAALEEWAEQNGWDVATGFIKSDLSEAPKKRGRPKKEVDDASSTDSDS